MWGKSIFLINGRLNYDQEMKYYLINSHSYYSPQIEFPPERGYGLKDRPKWDSYRIIPVPAKTMNHLYNLITCYGNGEPECLVFHGPTDYYRLIGSTVIRKHL